MSREAVVEAVQTWWGLIAALARERNLEPTVLAGLVAQESAGERYAERYEPAYRWLYDKPEQVEAMRPALMSRSTFIGGQKRSYGLCQIMGGVALERGFRGWWGKLFEPKTNLGLGADHLAWCIQNQGGSLKAGLLQYNGGGDLHYADRVLAWSVYFKEE